MDNNVMATVPVLLLTRDDALGRHWQGLDSTRWSTVRAANLDELQGWRQLGHRLVLVDISLLELAGGQHAAPAEGLQGLDAIVADTSPDDERGRQVLSAGAKGYVHAYMPATAMDTVLTTVSAGSVWLGPTLLARLLRQIDNRLPRNAEWYSGLTQREREVAERAAMGHGNQAIADALGITERTVRAHLSAVFEKLGVSDRLMLALKVHGVCA